tara:strand:+ start:43 stop:255 length:213 start_codon:yes stop_codon:yes gene_type:complete
MGMSSYILDNVDLFFEIGDKKIEETNWTGNVQADFSAFRKVMQEHTNLLSGSEYAEDVEQAIYQVWSDNI